MSMNSTNIRCIVAHTTYEEAKYDTEYVSNE
jgi:hypothetical protein